MPVPRYKKEQRNALRVKRELNPFFADLFPTDKERIQFVRTAAKSAPFDPLRVSPNNAGAKSLADRNKLKFIQRERVAGLLAARTRGKLP
ncbi:Uncharacterised protein [uncultured archaeon]|nr:Uncharacterised protein [uncultured archaeon]